MQKYLTLLSISWQNGFVYRISLYMWRIRQFLGSFAALTIWTVIFSSNGQFATYSRSEMISYIFIVAFLQSIIFSSVLNGLAGDIYSGKITHQLLKPINIYVYLGMQDIADKFKNTGFLALETVILYLMFLPEIIFPGLYVVLGVVLLVVLATFLNFLISLLFGAIGFWSPDAWAPRFLFFLMIELSAGRTFPLDILPQSIQTLLELTPFPYLAFIQTQLFLGRLPATEIPTHFGVMLLWIGVLGFATYKVWSKGLKDYSAVGQ